MLQQIIANDLIFDVILIADSLVLFSLVFMFVVNRRNMKRKIEYLESLQSDYKGISELISPPSPAEPPDNFKIAIQNHLNEISERLKSNEKLTNSLINQVDAIRDVWFEQTEDADEDQPKSKEEAQEEQPKTNPESVLSDEPIHENEQDNN